MNTAKNLPLRLKRTEFESNSYFEVIAPGVTLEEVMSGDFWVHVRNNFRVHDVIVAVAADGAFDAELRITSLNKVSGDIRFRLLSNVKGQAGAVVKSQPAERFEIKHRGAGRFAIVERKTGDIAADGLDKDTAAAEKAKMEAERQAA